MNWLSPTAAYHPSNAKAITAGGFVRFSIFKLKFSIRNLDQTSAEENLSSHGGVRKFLPSTKGRTRLNLVWALSDRRNRRSGSEKLLTRS
jgi:hypothetical protein